MKIPESGPESAERTAAVLRDLDRIGEAECRNCGKAICGHEAVFSLVMGLKDAPRCAACLALDLDREPAAMKEQLVEYVETRDCYRSGWRRASRQEGFPERDRPGCLWSDSGPAPSSSSAAAAAPAPAVGPVPADAEWDAGDMGCGDLVLELRGRMAGMRPGQVLALTARDPGAPEDLPAWCRLTGHALAAADHPRYFIRRKED